MGDYENCRFVNCNFSNTDLSKISFTACEFKGSNLSMAKLMNTGIKEVKFLNCKLLGLHFDTCNHILFQAYFDTCLLNLSSFYKLKIKKTTFTNCSLREVDFTETDLSGSLFNNCDLAGALFQSANLEKADLRSSYNYSIDPERNRINKAKFSLIGISGLLDKYDIEIE